MKARRESLVYFVSPVGGGPIRIGYSTGAERRLRALQVYSPVPLEILATLPGTKFLEAWLLDHFRDDVLHGDWLKSSFHLHEVVEAARRGVRHPVLPQSDLSPGYDGRSEALRYIRRELLQMSAAEFGRLIGVAMASTISDAAFVRVMRLLNERGIPCTVEHLNELLIKKAA